MDVFFIYSRKQTLSQGMHLMKNSSRPRSPKVPDGFAAGPRFPGFRSRNSFAVVVVLLLFPWSLARAEDKPAPTANNSPPSAMTTALPDTPAAPQLPDAPSAPQLPGQGFLHIGTAAKTIGSDQLQLLKYPFQVKALKWDGLFLGTTALLIATDETVDHQVPQSWHSSSLTLSNFALGADTGIAGGILLTGLITHNPHAEETGIRAAEAGVDAMILLTAAKAVFARQRPYSGTGEGKFFSGNWTNGSFPSGHAMFTWTMASVVAHEYHPLWLKLLVYGLATTVSTSRVTAREHFPSDVVVGGVLGYGIGAFVANQDKPKNIQGHPFSQSRVKRMEDAVLDHIAIQ
jgi:membrane-associated phospholipid phosphatase